MRYTARACRWGDAFQRARNKLSTACKNNYYKHIEKSMKKTLITLLALAGVAIADEPITIGSYYTKDSVQYDAVENLVGKTKAEAKNEITNADNYTFDVDKTITLNTANMLVSDSSLITGTELQLTGFSYISRIDANDQSKNATVSITIGDVTYTSEKAVFNGGANNTDYGLVSYSFSDAALPTFKLGSDLTFTIDCAGTDNNQKLGFGFFQGLSGAVTLYGAWQGAFQLQAVTVPEPATATLSLLALTGLAARRRRH